MFTEDKVTEIFFMADEFCIFFDSRMEKYALRDHKKRIYHRESIPHGVSEGKTATNGCKNQRYNTLIFS